MSRKQNMRETDFDCLPFRVPMLAGEAVRRAPSAPCASGQPPMYAAAPQEFHSHQPPHQMAFAHQMPQMPQMPQAPQLPQASQLPPAPSSTAFSPLPAESSLVVVNDHPKVGLQNTNNTCYMNSFSVAMCDLCNLLEKYNSPPTR